MEGLHFSAVQQLQLELVEARERSGLLKEESAAPYPITKDAPQFVHDKGHREARGSLNGKSAEHSNSNEENATNFAALGNASQDQISVGNARLVEPQSQHSLQDIQNISSQFQDTLNLNHLEDREDPGGQCVGLQ